jgi:hypothetical protein
MEPYTEDYLSACASSDKDAARIVVTRLTTEIEGRMLELTVNAHDW